ncbi:MAG: ABC transporter permease [Bryobacteraceae bacterium]
MSQLCQAVRSILKRPVFAITATLTIALGVGANTAVYAVIHAVLLDPLPFRQPNRLVQVWETYPGLHRLPVSVPDYLDWEESSKTLDLAAYTFQAMDKASLLGRGNPLAVQATNATASLFGVLGIKPLLGRVYSTAEVKNKAPVALISERLWRRKFSASRNVIGRPLQLGKDLFTIVGVIPQKNGFPVWADVWLPFSLTDPALIATRKFHPLEVIGRLKPGASSRQAEVEMETIARRLSTAYPATNGKVGGFIVPLIETFTGEVRTPLLAAWLAVGLVLLIASANLAHLMMSRALNRRHEIALRLALGASRTAVLRIFVIEASLLSLAGGLLGITGAGFALPLIKHLANGQIPRLAGVGLNLPVLLFGTAASLLVALLFAAPSYLQVFRSDLNSSISSGNTRAFPDRQSWLSPVLMGSEVALSLAVLLSATVLVRSFSLTLETQPGFRANDVLVTHAFFVDRDSQKSYERFRNRVAPGLESIAGVQSVAAVNAVPMSLGTTEHSRYATRFGIPGVAFKPGGYPIAQTRWCTPTYFHALGIPLLRGRWLTETDRDHRRDLINAAFAKRYFPHANPVGRKILFGVTGPHPVAAEIVGVVGDVRSFSLNSPPVPTIYSMDVSPEMDMVIKTAGSGLALRSAISETLHRIDPQVAIGPVKPLNAYISSSLAKQRFTLALISSFAFLAICFCAVGIYGVFSYSVTRRIREFGIRSALGARRRDLAVQVIKECLAVVVPGLLVGIGISAAFSHLLRTLLYRVSPTDALSSGIAMVSILLLCIGSVTIPALRAARADPAQVLREQ